MTPENGVIFAGSVFCCIEPIVTLKLMFNVFKAVILFHWFWYDGLFEFIKFLWSIYMIFVDYVTD